MARDTSEMGLKANPGVWRPDGGGAWFPAGEGARSRSEASEHDSPIVDIDREQDFLKLFLAHERRIHAFILALVPNWSDAEDLLQQTSTVMWRKLDQFEPSTNFLAWALGIARYEILNYRRKQQRELVIFNDEIVEQLADSMESMALTADDRRDALAVCIGKLADRDRELIHLRYQDAATLQGVADRVGRSLQAVYKSLNRIHGQLLVCIRSTLAAESILQ